MVRSSIFTITGGLGFIGKHFVRRCLKAGHMVLNIDSISYAADRHVNAEFEAFKNYRHYKLDIAELNFLPTCDVFINFAAESHVDNAITSPWKFSATNYMGVQRCLELVRQKQAPEQPLFVQISTDEVYGDILDGGHSELDRLVPSNPYSATKAAADMLVKSWGRTYGITWNIIRPNNNYGHHQYPEKLIPKTIWRMQRGHPAVLHGDGSYVRSWLHVEDTVDAILTVVEKGERNSIYNVGSGQSLRNIEVVRKIAALSVPEAQAYVTTADRSGQDVRYSLDDSRLRNLGWAPKREFDVEIAKIARDFDITRFV
jgi:dTDP-glucose 4,6-dehydratase